MLFTNPNPLNFDSLDIHTAITCRSLRVAETSVVCFKTGLSEVRFSASIMNPGSSNNIPVHPIYL